MAHFTEMIWPKSVERMAHILRWAVRHRPSCFLISHWKLWVSYGQHAETGIPAIEPLTLHAVLIWKQSRCALLAIPFVSLVVVSISVRTGKAVVSQPTETWIVAALLFVVYGVCIVLACQGGRRNDRVAALLAGALMVWLMYGFIDAVT